MYKKHRKRKVPLILLSDIPQYPQFSIKCDGEEITPTFVHGSSWKINNLAPAPNNRTVKSDSTMRT